MILKGLDLSLLRVAKYCRYTYIYVGALAFALCMQYIQNFNDDIMEFITFM